MGHGESYHLRRLCIGTMLRWNCSDCLSRVLTAVTTLSCSVTSTLILGSEGSTSSPLVEVVLALSKPRQVGGLLLLRTLLYIRMSNIFWNAEYLQGTMTATSGELDFLYFGAYDDANTLFSRNIKLSQDFHVWHGNVMCGIMLREQISSYGELLPRSLPICFDDCWVLIVTSSLPNVVGCFMVSVLGCCNVPPFDGVQ